MPTVAYVQCERLAESKLECTGRNYTLNGTTPPEFVKLLSGPLIMFVNDTAASIRVQGVTSIGKYDGIGRIIWPGNEIMPNGSFWEKQGTL